MLAKLIVLAALLATPVSAEELALKLPDGATWTIRAEHSRKVEGQHAQDWSLTTVKRLTWHKGEPSTVVITPLSSTPAAGPPELARGQSLANPATVEVDAALAPRDILNVDEVRAEFVKLVPRASGAPDSMIKASTLAMAASELGMASRLQGLSLPGGKALTFQGELALVPGGVVVKTRETVQLEVSYPARHRAVVVWRQIPDPDSYRAGLSAMLAAMARDRVDPVKIEEARAAWAHMTLTGENRCRDEIDTTTGLAISVECSLTQTISDGQKVQRSTDHWIITQSSPEKS